MGKRAKFSVSVLLGLVLLVMALWAVWMQPRVVPGAEAQTWATPQGAAFGGGDWVMASWANTMTFSSTVRCGTELQTAAYVLADLQSIGDFTTGADRVTCTMEYSNDYVNWCTLMHTVTAFTTDTIRCDQFHLFGRYSRICCDSDGTDWFTMTHRAKLFN